MDVSRAFRHVKIDPGDYDLLGLEWQGMYVDMYVPFGTRHGSKIFQRLSDAVRYMMRQKGYVMFLPTYNGISLYDHKQVDVTLELDACLTGFGGRSGNFVYHLPIERGFRNWTIVHLEMINILIAIRLFKFQWASQKVLIRCDNEAVVTVLKSGKTRDPYLAACARNIWFESALADIDLQYAHIRGVDNKVADVLSRWQGSIEQTQWLHSQVVMPIWLSVSYQFLELDPEL